MEIKISVDGQEYTLIIDDDILVVAEGLGGRQRFIAKELARFIHQLIDSKADGVKESHLTVVK